MDLITRRVAASVRAPSETGNTVVIASTASPDRMDDIVDQSAWKLDRYRANPVILWAHDPEQLPVGKCVRVDVENGALVAEIEWDESTEMGATVARQFREGFLSAVSVGFRPGRMVPRSQLPPEDPRRKDGGYGVVFYECELLEISAVPIPANADALAIQRSADEATILDLLHRIISADRAALQRMVDEIVQREVAALRQAIGDEVREALSEQADETAARSIERAGEWFPAAPRDSWFQ